MQLVKMEIKAGQVWESISPYGAHNVVLLVLRPGVEVGWDVLVLAGSWIAGNNVVTQPGGVISSLNGYWISDEGLRLA